ncbi:hypothetical protein AABB24_023564 [Solanum stoloniferum]|uniref:Myb-like domain-containing protein n=1 Tax=Solanum stoloniferum TaxID=62892 RepID=A0ABD2SK12_9SOLN
MDSSSMLRDYRKGNWTIQETMVLIEAKKMDDERRMKRQGGDGNSSSERGNINKPGELRWKWVEDYCWRHGCLRSQNQCNDKWDNLMRDFKKVREYERRVSEKLLLAQGDDDNIIHQDITKSYWKIERIERKEKNLPTNMLPEIYEALVQVVDKRGQKVLVGTSFNPSTTSMSPTLQQLQIATLPLPPPPPPPNVPYTQPLPTVDV